MSTLAKITNPSVGLAAAAVSACIATACQPATYVSGGPDADAGLALPPAAAASIKSAVPTTRMASLLLLLPLVIDLLLSLGWDGSTAACAVALREVVIAPPFRL